MLFPKNVVRVFENTKDAIADIPYDFNNNANKIGEFIINNPEIVASMVGLAFSMRHVIRSLIVSHRVKQQQYRKDHTLYDPHSGFTFTLRRKLTNNDYAEIYTRQDNGEKLYNILNEINVI